MKSFQFSRRAPGMPWWKVLLVWGVCRFIVRVVFVVWFDLRLFGRGTIPQQGPVIFVANHQSHLDPPLVGVLAGDRPCAFLARSTLFRNRLFGSFIRLFNAVPLEREGTPAGAMRTALRELDAGRAVILFPEGTRSKDARPDEFKPGMLLLVRRSRAQVVPVAIEGAFDVWPRARARPFASGRVALSAGAPIEPDALLALAPAEAMEMIRRKIESMRIELRRRIRTMTNGKRPKPGPADQPYWDVA